ncbi:uncharacterized protein LOC129243539 [Anastrepha obliqua]|nr:uncharacterized protein LOC129243539 [Anastrepha obliqua]
MFDYCHLIKSVRNTLMKYDILTSDGVTSFKVIEKLFDIDQMNPHFKICPKLTEAHIYPNFMDKMSVSRATQVLSNSVASGIDMALSQNLLGSDEYVIKCAKPTQMFVKKMNDLFDELDAKRFQSKNPSKCPIRRGDSKKIDRLNEHLDFLRSFQLPENARVQCIEGFRITISAMQMLCEELFIEHSSLKFIFTGKMNQDALENFFYRIRASQGMNTHPSAHEIQYIVARLISMKILRQRFEKKGSNCTDDDDLNLDWYIGPEDRHLETEVGDQRNEDLVLEEIDVEDIHFAEESNEAEVQVQRYFTGYGIYQKMLCKLKCEKCTNAMTKTKGELKLHSEALIRSKNFTDDSDLRLVNPEDRVFEVCRLQMVWYRQLFAKYAHIAGLRCLMLSALKEKTQKVFPDWFVGSGECRDHREKLLDFLLTVLLFKNAKWLLRNEVNKVKERKLQNKLKKL